MNTYNFIFVYQLKCFKFDSVLFSLVQFSVPSDLPSTSATPLVVTSCCCFFHPPSLFLFLFFCYPLSLTFGSTVLDFSVVTIYVQKSLKRVLSKLQTIISYLLFCEIPQIK